MKATRREFSAMDKYREAAKRLFHDEGRIEVDARAIVSEQAEGGDAGRYVQAWVWVSDDDAKGAA